MSTHTAPVGPVSEALALARGRLSAPDAAALAQIARETGPALETWARRLIAGPYADEAPALILAALAGIRARNMGGE